MITKTLGAVLVFCCCLEGKKEILLISTHFFDKTEKGKYNDTKNQACLCKVEQG